ncbi:MAG: ornithine cyclodeaminase family protein [Chloroflexota bacterium]
MVLLLRNHEMKGLMPMSAYIEAVESAYLEVGMKRGLNIPRENHWIAGDRADSVGGGHLRAGSKASFKYKGGFLPEIGGAGIQAYTAGLPGGLETYMFLFSTETGALIAVMEVLYYDWLKTAAVTAVATKHMAPAESRVVALFGTGRHARTQLRGLCAARPMIERVQAYSRRPEQRTEFCQEMSAALGLEVVPAKSPQAALDQADIITTITNSPTPVFDAADVPDRPIHINGMGAHYPWVSEIDADLVLRSRIVLDDWDQGLQEQGEVLQLIEAGQMSADNIAGDLGDVVSGKIEGRRAQDRSTLFLSGGTGIEDVAVSLALYRAAMANGVGTTFEFNQPYEFEI